MVERTQAVLSGFLLPGILTALAVFLLIYLRGAPFAGFFRALRRRSGGGSSVRAVLMALAGTLGVGNITGVADAIRRGGPGVLFWMWASAFAAMVVKYAEILLIMRRKDLLTGGASPMDYMRPAAAGGLFALSGLVCAFSVGSALQASAVAQSFETSFGVGRALPCLMLGGVALFCILRGKNTLFALTTVLIPLFTALYLFLCLSVIVGNAGQLPRVFGEIFSQALSFRCAAKGLTASALVALRYGVIRGLLSSEAGCGTAPIAHAHASAQPSVQGRFGVIEVAVDTLLLCTATGLAVLLVPLPAATPTEAVALALSSVFGSASRVILPASLFCFAFATLLCWSLYLDCFSGFLFGNGKIVRRLMQVLFCAACGLSLIVGEAFLWQAADLSVTVMTLINLGFIFVNRRELKNSVE